MRLLGSARIGPELPPTIVMATEVKELIDPTVPPTVAEALVKSADPKLARVVSLQWNPLHSAGLSTTHSADDLAAPETAAEEENEFEPSVSVTVTSPVDELYVTLALTVAPGWTAIPEIVTMGLG